MAIESQLQFWNNGKPIIADTNSNILNLTYWKNANASGNLAFLGSSEINQDNLKYWENGELIIADENPDILNLTHWGNADAFGNLCFKILNKAINKFDGKITIIAKETDNLDGLMVIPFKKVIISLLNGRMHVKDSDLSNLDGEIIIKIPINEDNLLDGKIELQTIAVGLVKIRIF